MTKNAFGLAWEMLAPMPEFVFTWNVTVTACGMPLAAGKRQYSVVREKPFGSWTPLARMGTKLVAMGAARLSRTP